MSEKEKPHPLLQKPLFIYSLPAELLNTIKLKGDANPSIEDTLGTTRKSEQESTHGTAGCVTCNIAAFTDVSQQREHVRSDLHKFNLKRKLAGQKIVDADEFDKMLDGILPL
jgi:hypothetical protein